MTALVVIALVLAVAAVAVELLACRKFQVREEGLASAIATFGAWVIALIAAVMIGVVATTATANVAVGVAAGIPAFALVLLWFRRSMNRKRAETGYGAVRSPRRRVRYLDPKL